MNCSDAELMQYLNPVGAGPSLKICPRCPSQFEHITSIRFIPYLLSSKKLMYFLSSTSKKHGQPVPESNFVSDENKFCPQPAHLYSPSFLLFQYLPVNALSVPFSLNI